MKEFARSIAFPPFVPERPLVRLFAEAGDKNALDPQHLNLFLRRLTRLTVQDEHIALRLKNRLQGLYDRTMDLKQESDLASNVTPERQRDMIKIYTDFFGCADPLLIPYSERKITQAALTLLRQQAAFPAHRDQNVKDSAVYDLHQPHPNLTLNIAAALLMDVSQHARDVTGADYYRTAAYKAFHNMKDIWQRVSENFPVSKRLWDYRAQSECTDVLQQISVVKGRIELFDQLNPEPDIANTPEADHDVIRVLKGYLRPYEYNQSIIKNALVTTSPVQYSPSP